MYLCQDCVRSERREYPDGYRRERREEQARLVPRVPSPVKGLALGPQGGCLLHKLPNIQENQLKNRVSYKWCTILEKLPK